MSRFAQINLLEVEDSVGAKLEGIEGRFGRKHLDSRDLGISHSRYPLAGQRLGCCMNDRLAASVLDARGFGR